MSAEELFKIFLNNGFMALFVIWYLFKKEPEIQKTIDKLTAEHRETLGAMIKLHKKCCKKRKRKKKK